MSQNLCGSYISNIVINDTSDHLPTVCSLGDLKTLKRKPMYVTSHDTRPKNMKALKRQLSKHDWSAELSPESLSVSMTNPYRNYRLLHSYEGT